MTMISRMRLNKSYNPSQMRLAKSYNQTILRIYLGIVSDIKLV